MASTVTWTSFALPNSLVNVGSEAVCTLCDNILCFTDLKTHAIQYYKAESPSQGLSISAITGHNRFPLVAFAEVVLRPSVHIIQYPSLEKYAVFASKDIICFVDIRFNEYDLLVALSGFPKFTICVWNFRTGQFLLQQYTKKESIAHSLLLSNHHIPQIVQYSEWNKYLMIWEICYSATGVDLHKVSRMTLEKEFAMCNIFSMCYGEDNNLYVVDNFGAVSMVQIAQFYMKPQWSVTSSRSEHATPKHFYICSHKQGLLVHCKDAIYYIRKKVNAWCTEWRLENVESSGGIVKLVSNAGGDIYASAAVGNVYQVEAVADSCSLREVHTFNKNSIDFIVLKGVREECMIQLTTGHTLRAVDMGRIEVYSEIEIPDINTIAGHNQGPYVVVGTTTGKLHYINYANIREPKQVASTQTENGYAIGAVQFLDNLAAYRNIYYDFYLVYVDVANGKLYELAPIVHIPEHMQVCHYFMGDNNSVYIFLTQDEDLQLPHATELWSFAWDPVKNEVTCHKYHLPQVYRDVTIMMVPMKDTVEFIAARMKENIIDIFHLTNSSQELVLISSLRTKHLVSINGIVGSRNLLTWGVDGTVIHFRSHKKSAKPYAINQMLQIKYRPRVVKRVLDCFNAKYLVYMYSTGGIKIMKVSNAANAPLLENTYLNEEADVTVIKPHHASVKVITSMATDVVVVHTPEEMRARDNLLKRIKEFANEVTALIDYDIAVTGKTHGVFKKFCLNHHWLESLNKEAKRLCEVETESLTTSIADQTRVRDWIRNLIMANSESITFKIRAIFSHFSFENYGRRRSNDCFTQLYDMYRFYDMTNVEEADEEDEISQQALESSEDSEAAGDRVRVVRKTRKYMVIQGSAYDHVISEDLALQDIDTVTANQMYNQDAKIRIMLTDHLKEEFNRKFEETRKIKFDLMEAILATNASLSKIYENMNCMLRLLKMNTFRPPELSVPLWQKDEFIQRIMEVDDSEIKAVNRRKKKAEVTAVKQGRLLLWSLDFWSRALMVMMDGVLEKLWEEEIKKEIPVPEFMLKKEPTEYTLEDQKALRDYEEKLRILIEDRKKYLQLLSDQDSKINEMKTNYILKLNVQVTQMMIMKLKYDFCIKHVRLRNLNVKMMNYNKMQWVNRITILRADIEKIGEYIIRYTKLADFWNKSVEELRSKVENLMLRERAIERQFKNHFLNVIPQHMGPEMTKAFKKRPKLSPKVLQSTLICKELSARVNSKSQPKYPFPVPKDVYEYLDGLTALDDTAVMPNTMDPRHWEQFVKTRRQKVEMELKVKAVNLQLVDTVTGMNYFNKELQNLKGTKVDAHRQLQEAQDEYIKSIYNQSLELRLTMGQVELNIMGSLATLENCILMHVDDINDINALILKVGQMKLKAMHRVAFFRRQVIFKEWEHKVVSANIEYLKFMLHVIAKCKVSMEFLNILRNWAKVRSDKQKMLNTVGLIERAITEKQISFRRQLERLNSKISAVRQQIDDMRRSNKQINRQIDDVKVAVAFSTTNRDVLIEDKRRREQNEKMDKLKKRSQLIDTVRRDYAHIMELKTILELQRLRTYPTLGPNPDHCMK